MAKYEFGIDLGTTNSVISVMRGVKEKRPVVIPVDGKQTLPSCVKLSNGNFIVGAQAYEDRYKPCAIYSVKRLIGTQEVIKLVDEVTGIPSLYTPIEISAEILKKLKRSAEAVYGVGNVEDVTITVPAAFNHLQRDETRQAGVLAGFNVVKIINEPTSAALAYGLDLAEEDSCIAVYDLGGGTFDISVLVISGVDTSDIVDVYGILGSVAQDESRNFRVITKEGNTKLGGDDIDEIVTKLALRDAAHKMYMPELEHLISHSSYEELVLKVEKYKKVGMTLTYTDNYTVHTKDGGSVDITFTVSPEHFNEAVDLVYAKTKALLDKCLGRLKGRNINKLILVGGSTKSARIVQNITRDYDFEIYSGLNPDEAVGLGAAVQTSVTLGNSSNSVLDVVPESIGIEVVTQINDRTLNGVMKKLIFRDELIPARSERTFNTTYDDQDCIIIKVYQGASELVEDNLYLGELRVDVKKNKQGEERASVIMKVDGNGILYCYVNYNGVTHEQKLINVFGTTAAIIPENKKYLKWFRKYQSLGIYDIDMENALDEFRRTESKSSEEIILAKLKEFDANKPDKKRPAKTAKFAD